jgi:hypothetical protein
MRIKISGSYGQVYLLPTLKITYTRYLNGDLEVILGFLFWEIIVGF